MSTEEKMKKSFKEAVLDDSLYSEWSEGGFARKYFNKGYLFRDKEIEELRKDLEKITRFAHTFSSGEASKIAKEIRLRHKLDKEAP